MLGKMRSSILRGRSSERVAIFDATNSTQARREWISTMCRAESMRNSSLFEKSIDVVFVESICDDQELLDENYRYKVSSSPDFRGIPVAGKCTRNVNGTDSDRRLISSLFILSRGPRGLEKSCGKV